MGEKVGLGFELRASYYLSHDPRLLPFVSDSSDWPPTQNLLALGSCVLGFRGNKLPKDILCFALHLM
jgi:hypothetical protein